MKQPALFCHAAAVALAFLFPVPTQALTIQFDYTFDGGGSGFFSQNPAAKAALEAAATDVSSAIFTSLSGIASSDYTVTGYNGSTSVTFDWNYTISPPGSSSINLPVNPITPDTVVIYAGMHPFQGTTLGQGGTAGMRYSYTMWGFSSEWSGALDEASHLSEQIFGRDGGPTVHEFEGTNEWNGYPGEFSVSTGIGVGSVWFDSDTNNNGTANTLEQLEQLWHFDHTTSVAAGKYDFYTVALHEILHALGIGETLSWEMLVNGNDWLGAQASDIHGTGTGLISSDGVHVAAGVISQRISDGALQTPVMTPTLAAGERKLLTAVDLALLQDIGWNTALAVPEPGPASLVAAGLCLIFSRRRRTATPAVTGR